MIDLYDYILFSTNSQFQKNFPSSFWIDKKRQNEGFRGLFSEVYFEKKCILPTLLRHLGWLESKNIKLVKYS